MDHKGKKPQKIPSKESAQGSSSKDEHTQKPLSQQASKEEAEVKGISKGKKPEKAATKESAPGPSSSSSKDAQPQTPPSGPPAKEETAPGASKGKKPAPGASKRKQAIQLPPGKTKHCTEHPKHFLLHILESYDPLEDTDPSDAILPSLSEKANGKLPAPTETIVSYKRWRVYILRIPIARDGPLTRVKVSVRGDTASRHWQTFFFKNIVRLEPFWGYNNDKAHVATRIVRLMMADGKPTPYFLMACIGEFPRIKSPRNDNGIFERLHYGPIYNDAFVFKLGDPELGVAGYANYVDMDKDIDGIDWLREAIRLAAKKVEWAMARHANPGFPDMSNYADKETMVKDVGGMLYVKAMIMKANEKYGATNHPTDADFGLPRLERMRDIVDAMLEQTRIWKHEGLLSKGVVESALDDAFGQKTIEFFSVSEEALTATKMDETPSASTEVDSTSAKTKELWKRAEKCFNGACSAYKSVSTPVFEKIEDKMQYIQRIRDPHAECDTIWLKYMLTMIIKGIVEKKTDRNNILAMKSGAPYMKVNDLLGVIAQAAYQAIEENKPSQEIIQLVIEINEISQIFNEKTGGKGLWS